MFANKNRLRIPAAGVAAIAEKSPKLADIFAINPAEN